MATDSVNDGLDSYPEHRKVKACVDKSQAIGEFLEWAMGKGITLCKSEKTGVGWGKDDVYEYLPQSKSIDTLLAEYFEIDLKKLEAEKRTMLDEIRKINDKENQ